LIGPTILGRPGEATTNDRTGRPAGGKPVPMTIANPHRTRLTTLDGESLPTRGATDRRAGESHSTDGAQTLGLQLAGAADEAGRD